MTNHLLHFLYVETLKNFVVFLNDDGGAAATTVAAAASLFHIAFPFLMVKEKN